MKVINKTAWLESGESVFDLLDAQEQLAAIRAILAAAVPQPESVECPAKCVGGRVPSPIKTEPWSNCKSCSGTGRIPAPERTVVEMAEAVVALSLESENIGWQRAHDPATCGHPRACWQDKNWPESEKNYNPETFSSDPPMEYRCLMCELTAERDRLAARVKTFESSDLAKLLQDREKEWQVAADKGVAETVERCAKIADKWDTFIGDAIRATAPKEPTAAEPRGEGVMSSER